ncbi:dipeptide/oligopeptide/nickel ABC transporter permease/ATP-binding protein [Ornithinimicrobium sufpigmenti]|uniref:dipeptide/oligopeptide/nickel ABC transporter permease/ATP-binding protein n=1 Tax=Ornithinimicrobium sufpigmenti TaxID=2508882 RepID=UPI00192DA25F|nr:MULTISPECIES: dipeptide/oligopeptide/nickel ABC transporter permease/ATP-binding protein [unclassified Ornithinimicrobium]
MSTMLPQRPVRRQGRGTSMRRMLVSPLGLAALAVNLLILFLLFFGPAIWGEAANTNNIEALGSGPTPDHPFGTDALGRDILARVLVATRLSVGLALAATAMGMAIGIVVGCVAALSPPPLARLITGLIDILVAFPGLLLALFFAIIFGVGPQGAVLALGTAMTPAFARLTYTLAAGVVGRDYVSAARTLGISRARILFRHVLPNIGEPLIINGTLAASGSLLAFAGLSFLGLGVQLPDYDWGRMLSDGLNAIYTNPLAALAPGLAIVLASLAFNLTGEAGAQLLGRRVSLSPARARRLVDEAIAADTHVRDDHVPVPDDAVLRAEGLSVAIPLGDDTVATPVRDLSFAVGRGEAVGIVGESGSGKTLTAMAVSQLTDPPVVVRARRLELDGLELTTPSDKARRRHLGQGLSMVFQDPMSSLNPTMRTGTQLAEHSREHQGTTRRAAWDRAVDRLRAVRIPSPGRRARQYPHELSGGMRQRAMIAMGLMGEPALIIADEPTTALDVTVQEQVLRVLKRAQREQDAALLLISHDLSVISAMCDRVLVMYAGRVVEVVDVAGLTTGPAHPYTRGLLATLPDMHTDRSRPLATILGRPPHPADLPQGCAFAARCPFATDVCLRVDPALAPSPTGGSVACHHPQKGPVGLTQPQEEVQV